MGQVRANQKNTADPGENIRLRQNFWLHSGLLSIFAVDKDLD